MHGVTNHIYLQLKKEKNTKRHWYNALGGSSVILRRLVSFRVKTFIFGSSDQDDFFHANTKLISKIKHKKTMDI